METIINVVYKTIDGKIFPERGPDGYDKTAQSKAIKHEKAYIKETIGEHPFYLVAFLDETGEIKGYIPKIHKDSNFTKHFKFAKRFYKFDVAYNLLGDNMKLIGVDK